MYYNHEINSLLTSVNIDLNLSYVILSGLFSKNGESGKIGLSKARMF